MNGQRNEYRKEMTYNEYEKFFKEKIFKILKKQLLAASF